MRCLFLLALLPLTVSARSLQNIEYTQVSGQTLRMDGYIPDTPGPHPAAIIVHGGAWVTGDKTRTVQPLFKPLTDAGIAWFSIEYRLARGNDLESLISLEGIAALRNASDDVRAAIAFVRTHASEWGIDNSHIALIGESAGAHLASMAGLKPAPEQPIQAVVAFYSPSDLAKLLQSDPRIPEAIRKAVKGTVMETMLLNGLKQVSPQTWVTKDAPPFLMIHGTADNIVPVEQSESMCKALQDAGAQCELIVVRGAGHGFNRWEGQPAMTEYKTKMIDWLKTTLGLKELVALGAGDVSGRR
jgi:alpha-L-fucosidase 2